MKQDELGNRMKRYEASTKQLLPRRTYTVIRVDGKSFGNYTKGLVAPFDDDFVEAMNATARALCSEVQGAILAYVQSDEITVVLQDMKTISTDAWYDGNVQKQVSVSASIATEAFNRARLSQMIDRSRGGIDARSLTQCSWGQFDSRVFTIPDPIEVANNLIWRQKDAMKNSVSSVARSMYSHKELEGKNTEEKKEMIAEAGKAWDEYDEGCQRGRIILKATRVENTNYTRTDTNEIVNKTVNRSYWKASNPPVFTDQPDFLKNLIEEEGDTNKN